MPMASLPESSDDTGKAEAMPLVGAMSAVESQDLHVKRGLPCLRSQLSCCSVRAVSVVIWSTAFLRRTDAYDQSGSKPEFSKPSSPVQASLIHRPVTPPGISPEQSCFMPAQCLNTRCGNEQVSCSKAAIINCDSTLEKSKLHRTSPRPHIQEGIKFRN